MTNRDKDSRVEKILPLLNKNQKLLKLGEQLAERDSDIRIDFSGVKSLSKDQQRYIFSEWAKPSPKERRPYHEFIIGETVDEKIGDILDDIAKDENPFKKNLCAPLIRYWFSKNWLFMIPLSSVALILLGFLLAFSDFQNSYRVDSSEITIGTIFKPDTLKDLELHLERSLVPNNYFDYLLKKKINVTIEGKKDISYKLAESKIRNKEWDIFFASSPILSIKSRDNQYTWGFKMFPRNKNDTYTSGFFVRADSQIKGIEQINSSTTVALGEPLRSASSFVVPVYELFGKNIKVSTGYRGDEIIEMIKSGQADVGAAAITDNRISRDSAVRLISESRPIPGSGVYFSPRLSRNDRTHLKEAMKDASKEMQLKANYGVGTEPDYTEFRTIIKKVDEILVCADFAQENVKLFCPKGFTPKILVGTIYGWKAQRNNYILFLKEDNNGSTLNHIVIEKELFRSIFDASDPQGLQATRLKTKTPKAKNTGSDIPTFFIQNAAQMEILN